MGKIRQPDPAALFLAALYAKKLPDEFVESLVVEHFGKIMSRSPVFAFDFSDYYREEMGPDLRKVFFVFETLIDPAALPEWKHRAIELENRHTEAGKRTLNLDPGYLQAPKLVLATTKNFTHRVYIGNGIYGDVQLYLRDGKFQINPWTYPDYKHPDHLAFFEQARKKYLNRLPTTQSGSRF